MKKTLIYTVILALCLVSASMAWADVTDKEQDQKKKIYQAKDLMFEDQYAEALKVFNYISQDKKSKYRAEALYYAARCLAKLNKLPRATEKLNVLLKKFPASSWKDDALALKSELLAMRKKQGDLEVVLNDQQLAEVNRVLQANEQHLERAAQIAERTAQELDRPNQKVNISIRPRVIRHPRYQDDKDCNDADGMKEAALTALMHMDDEARALKIAKKFIASDPCDRLLEQALLVIAQFDSQEAFNTLLDYVRNGKSSRVKQMAILWLGEFDSDEAYKALVETYDSVNDVESRKQILFALADRDDERAVKKIIDIAKNDPSMEIRRHAVLILYESGRGSEHNKLVSKELIAIYRATSDRQMKRHIMLALGEMETPEVTALAKEMALNDPDPDVRRDVIIWLADSDDPGAIDVLAQIYRSDKDPKVRSSALWSVINHNQEEKALQFLKQFFSEAKTKEDKRNIAVVFSQFDSDEAADILMELLKKETDKELKRHMLIYLGQMDSEKAQEYLIQAMEEKLK